MKEPDTNTNYEQGELEETSTNQDTAKESSSFYDIKEKASMNLSQLLEDLQANENHEIDQLLMRKIHDRFLQEFPFMEQVESISPTMSYYKIGTYYHDRPTIGIDASLPEIFVLPRIDEEWEKYSQPETTDYDKKINELDAKVITAQTEIERLDEQIKEINRQMTDLDDNKGFLNRKKIEEEIQELEKKKQVLSNEKLGWLPYIETPETIQQQKEALKQEARADQLRAAIVEKEQRQISRYFGSKEGFGQAIHEFLMNYLGNENPNNQSNEGGSEYE